MKSLWCRGIRLKRPDLQSEFSGDSWFVRKTHKRKLGDYGAGTLLYPLPADACYAAASLREL